MTSLSASVLLIPNFFKKPSAIRYFFRYALRTILRTSCLSHLLLSSLCRSLIPLPRTNENGKSPSTDFRLSDRNSFFDSDLGGIFRMLFRSVSVPSCDLTIHVAIWRLVFQWLVGFCPVATKLLSTTRVGLWPKSSSIGMRTWSHNCSSTCRLPQTPSILLICFRSSHSVMSTTRLVFLLLSFVHNVLFLAVSTSHGIRGRHSVFRATSVTVLSQPWLFRGHLTVWKATSRLYYNE